MICQSVQLFWNDEPCTNYIAKKVIKSFQYNYIDQTVDEKEEYAIVLWPVTNEVRNYTTRRVQIDNDSTSLLFPLDNKFLVNKTIDIVRTSKILIRYLIFP